MKNGDSLPDAFRRAVRKDFEYLRMALETEGESIFYYVVSELQDAAERNEQAKITEILRAIRKDKVGSALLKICASERLTYWLGIRQGPPPLKWMNPDNPKLQMANYYREFLRQTDISTVKWFLK